MGNNTYHCLGEPGGSGCPLSSMEITYKKSDGETAIADLLNAEKGATEIEMLRTIASELGVQWGHDDLGWWAVVKR
jgi:hypothetical protein